MKNKKYKVEIVQTEKFCIDVFAKDEKQAIKLASKKWNVVAENGTHHYYQTNDTETEIGTIYDVTGTDDPFNP